LPIFWINWLSRSSMNPDTRWPAAGEERRSQVDGLPLGDEDEVF